MVLLELSVAIRVDHETRDAQEDEAEKEHGEVLQHLHVQVDSWTQARQLGQSLAGSSRVEARAAPPDWHRLDLVGDREMAGLTVVDLVVHFGERESVLDTRVVVGIFWPVDLASLFIFSKMR